MVDITLYLGNKVFSSWSLRPWLALKHTGVGFQEITIPLNKPDTQSRILAQSPNGRVPVLKHGDLTVWESLAICEYLNDVFPAAKLWPSDRTTRAHARASATEMHGGFAALRAGLPMNLRKQEKKENLDPAIVAEVNRIGSIWREARTRYGKGGPYLYGHFTIADAMYAPVVTRFVSYGIELDPINAEYRDAIWNLASMREWTRAAQAETWDLTG